MTANTVKKLLIDGTRRWYGLDLLLVTGAMTETLQVPQAGGFLVKQVAKDSVAARLGLRGGDRLGIVEGQQIVVGGDILLAVQGMPVTSNAEMVKVIKNEKPVELSMKWTGW